MKSKGFTLIELLVVIAVIAILAAIIFPVMASAKRRSQIAVCSSNLKQIGMSIQMYAQDANDYYPFALDPTDKFTPQIWTGFFQRNPNLAPPNVTISLWLNTIPMLHDVLQPYEQNHKIWRCGNDKGFVYEDFGGEALNARPSCFEKFNTSYFFRTEIAFRHSKVATFDREGEINVLFDGSGSWHSGGHIAASPEETIEYAPDYSYNVLYGDLHVKNVGFFDLQKAWAIPLQSGQNPF